MSDTLISLIRHLHEPNYKRNQCKKDVQTVGLLTTLDNTSGVGPITVSTNNQPIKHNVKKKRKMYLNIMPNWTDIEFI